MKFSNTLDLVWSAHTGSPPSPRPSDESLPGPEYGVDDAEDIIGNVFGVQIRAFTKGSRLRGCLPVPRWFYGSWYLVGKALKAIHPNREKSIVVRALSQVAVSKTVRNYSTNVGGPNPQTKSGGKIVLHTYINQNNKIIWARHSKRLSHSTYIVYQSL